MNGPYQVCEPLTPEEYEALKASIAEHGVRVPIEVDEEGNILDGHNRATIARELQIPCPTTVKSGLATPEEKRRYARELNCARRQMTPEKKRKIIEAQLIETPDLSNNWIAEIVGVQKNTVIAVRADLESTCQIDKLDRLRSKDGKLRPAEQTKPERFPWLNGPGWQDWHRMEARHYLKQLSEADKDLVSEMISSIPSDPSDTLRLLGGFFSQSEPKRERIRRLWTSEDTRDRDRAISLSAGQTAAPDPRIPLLEGAYDYVQRSIKPFPNDAGSVFSKMLNRQMRRERRFATTSESVCRSTENGLTFKSGFGGPRTMHSGTRGLHDMSHSKPTIEEQCAEIDARLEEMAPRLERTAEGRKALAATRKHFKEMDEAMDRIFEEGRKKLDDLFR